MTDDLQPTEPQRLNLPLARAMNAGMRAALEADEKVLIMGEDIGTLGGVFRVTEHLQSDFGKHRVFDTPLAESGIVGTAIGLAMRGYRPVCEIQFDGFVWPAFDQITSQLAKYGARTDGAVKLPIVIRIPYGGHVGAVEHHQESPETYFAHTPGLRVVSPSTTNDAYWMIQQAIRSDDPVIFLEPKSRYWPKGEVDTESDAIGLHVSRVAREGRDVTLVGFGAQTAMNLQAADLAEKEGVSIEVIDLRTLAPVDYGPIIESARKTGRVVVAQEASSHVSLGSEIAATISEKCFYSLEAPVLRVSGYNVPFPPTRLQDVFLPDVDRVLDAVDRVLEY
jgi:pyruvate dehydrogenase E1 component beta subunit